MKITGIGLLIFTSVVLVILSVLTFFNFPFGLLFYIMCFGQLLLIFTVYKVLTDDYHTDKTFEDGYEDHSPGMGD